MPRLPGRTGSQPAAYVAWSRQLHPNYLSRRSHYV